MTIHQQPSTDNQSGVATILAIGITALLLCLAIAYVTTSIVEKKAAANYQNMTSARIAAQTAFNRAIAQMKSSSTNINESFNEIVSHRNNMTSWTDADTETLATKLTTVIAGDTYYSLPSTYPTGYTATDSSAVSWLYLRADQTDTGQIIGRIAYVVIPDKGKIDPWSVIDSGVNAAAYSKKPPSEWSYGGSSNYTSVDAAGNYVTGRPGRDLTELSLASLEVDTSTFTSNYTKQMSVTTATVTFPSGGPTTPPGLVTVGSGGQWLDFEQIFNTLGIATTNDTTRNYFRDVFCVNAPPDPEAFWIDISNDSIRDPSELYHRFNLARTDWNNVTVDSIVNASGTKFESTLVGESNYLPWLSNWTDPGGFPSADSARRQIIANLITYCKTDTGAVTDNPNNPTYVGLERCPYINEVRITVPVKIIRSGPDSDDPGNRTYTLTQSSSTNFTVNLELVNMYLGSTFPANTVKAEVKVHLAYAISNSPTPDVTYDPGEITVPMTLTTALSGGTYTPSTYSATFTGLPTKLDKVYLNSSTLYGFVKVLGLTVKLTNNTGTIFYDYSNVNSETDYILIESDKNGFPNTNCYIDYEVRDPRQNLLATEWTRQVASFRDTAPPYAEVGTLGLANSVYPTTFTGADTDLEPDNTAPWNLSTAYIRKGPMKSPLELGLIHRAKAFQTLNLKKYNNLASNGYGFGMNSGGGSYTYGDANILDQIKMTSNTTTLGKINVNSDNQSVLRALFDDINLNNNLKMNPDPGVTIAGGAGTKSITTTLANTIADSIRASNGSQANGTTPFYTRASVVNAVPYLSTAALIGGYTRATDAQQEELIGKFINLTKAESPYQYTVIAVGEAIRDVGGTYYDRFGNALASPTVIGTYEPNSDEILASQKILAIIRRARDPATGLFNKFYILRMMYLSD